MLYPSSHQKRLFIDEPSKTKKRKNNSGRLSFLLSFDLRDYPLKFQDLSPSVSEPKAWSSPGFNEAAVLLPESFTPISPELAPSAPPP